MRLYLVRHGQTAWNAEERAQGHTDVPLDEKGLRQAACLAAHFEEVALDLILTSDLQRSYKTAQAIAEVTGAPLESTPTLRERAFGEWEGLLYHEFSERIGKASQEGLHSVYEVCPPGGETMRQAWDRVKQITDRMVKEEGTVLVVSHGGVCSLMLAQLLRGTLDTSRSFRFHNCAVTELNRRQDGTFMLTRFDDVSHIGESERPFHAATR